MNNKLGFTLIELLVVIGIVAALTTVVFVSINPLERFKDARDARRVTDADTILSAVTQYIVDTGGSLPAGVGTTYAQIGTCALGGGATFCTMLGATQPCVNLGVALSGNKYIKSNPMDPNGGNAVATGYAIVKDTNNVFTVYACLGEGSTITVSR
jgi:prepilin-type N-terminal cleavage/methylation domain-containing protein